MKGGPYLGSLPSEAEVDQVEADEEAISLSAAVLVPLAPPTVGLTFWTTATK
jgi:hypothetical protein